MTDDQDMNFRARVELIIFGTGTPAGRAFDVLLLVAIMVSVGVVMIDSVSSYHLAYGDALYKIEVMFTLLFTAEYLIRIWCVRDRLVYITSFWGIVDLLAILPTYIALLLPSATPLLTIRLLRMLRVFRVLRLFVLFDEFLDILKVLRSTLHSIIVFATVVLIVIVIFGCLMYVLEGPEHGFTSIPMSMYWAMVTITTVGYGDIVPQTGLGRAIAAAGMLVGYSILAVPTAIVTTKLWDRLSRKKGRETLAWNCPVCASGGHAGDAEYCKYCGSHLDVPEEVRAAADESNQRTHTRENLLQ